MFKFNKKTGMFEEDNIKHLKFNKKSGLYEGANNTDSSNNKGKLEFRDFFAYVVAFIAYVVAGFVLAIIFDWMVVTKVLILTLYLLFVLEHLCSGL